MKKIISLICALMVVSGMALAQRGEPVVIPLWPNGAPNDNHLTGEEGHPDPRSVNNVSKPELWVYPAFRPNGTVIIACPGGGYVYLEIEKEGTALAPWFNYIGVTLAVLKYRMPNGHFETSLSDVQEAIKIMRQHTYDWKVNPNKVGVMGCSAGGNLACEAAVQFTGPENRPDFQILLYPSTIPNSYMNNEMHGANATQEMIDKYTILKNVKPNTPRAFIACSADDPIVSFEESIQYFRVLQQNRIPSVKPSWKDGSLKNKRMLSPLAKLTKVRAFNLISEESTI